MDDVSRRLLDQLSKVCERGMLCLWERVADFGGTDTDG